MDKERTNQARDTITDRNANYAGCSPRPLTVREAIDRSIDDHNRAVARLVMLRDTTPAVLLDMPQSNLAALAFPEDSV